MKYAVVEIDLGTDYYAYYEGIRSLKIFDCFKEAQKYLKQENNLRRYNYNKYLSDINELAEKILKEDPDKKSNIVKYLYNRVENYNRVDYNRDILGTLKYILENKSNDYPELNLPKKPLFPDQFELDIINIDL